MTKDGWPEMFLTFMYRNERRKSTWRQGFSSLSLRLAALGGLLIFLYVIFAVTGGSQTAYDADDKAAVSDKQTLEQAGNAADNSAELSISGQNSENGESLQAVAEPSEKTPLLIWREEKDAAEQLTVGEYLAGVVAAEMPASYPLAALEAQAVAARTYLYRHQQDEAVQELRNELAQRDVSNAAADMEQGKEQEQVLLANADYRIFQAYISVAEMRTRWGEQMFAENYQKILQAVANTAGQIIVYNDQLIDPVYHASCGGQTENAEDVWSARTVYLRSVVCPEAEEAVSAASAAAAGAAATTDGTAGQSKYARYQVPVEKREFSLTEFDQRLGTSISNATAEVLAEAGKNATDELLKITRQSASGKINMLNISGEEFSGQEVRSKLGLKSTEFSWEIGADRIVITTVGYGHGVGMCQHGAGLMAEQGCSWQDIIRHYYSDVELVCAAQK